tara:strand:- start:64 stop:426 length:363 start_codon:yes stop_codon:yes gene_type:complete
MLFGVYLVRIVFAPEGLAKEFNADKSAILPLRYVGTFAAGIIFLGVYILFRPDGPAGTWAYFNLLFIVSIFQLLYDLLFYFKIIDKDIGAKNSMIDIGVSIFAVCVSAILIWGLSDKIYL